MRPDRAEPRRDRSGEWLPVFAAVPTAPPSGRSEITNSLKALSLGVTHSPDCLHRDKGAYLLAERGRAMSELTADVQRLLRGGREEMTFEEWEAAGAPGLSIPSSQEILTLRRVVDLVPKKRILRRGRAERDIGILATFLGYTVTHVPGGEYLIWPLGEAGDVPPHIGGLTLRGAAAWLVYKDARETMQVDWDTKLGLVRSQGSDNRPWRVQEGGSEADGFYVVGYSPFHTDPLLQSMPDLYGPYATFEDAEAVVAVRDSTVRPLSERLLERERQEWHPSEQE
jgi:hypothetical protein